MCTSNRDDCKLENTVKQSRFKHLGELHKEWTEAGVSASRVTTLRHLQEKGDKPLLKQKQCQKHITWAKEKNNWTVTQWSKVLFSDESKFCNSFGNQGPRVWRKSGEAQNPCCLIIMIIKLKWALFVTYTIIQSITSSEMCSLHLTHPSAHTTGAVEETLRRPGRSWGFSALLKGLTSVVDNSCRSRDSSPQSQVTSPTLYPLEPRLLEVQCEVSTVSDGLGCHVICWCWSTVFSEVHSQRSHLPGNFWALMLPSADKLYGDTDFIFQQDLSSAHTAKGTKNWFNDHGVTVLDWPAISPDLNPNREWGIVKRRMRDTRPNNADDLKAAIKATWASIPPQQCHRLITSMPRRIDAVIHAKGGPTKYRVHRNKHTFQKLDISV